MGRPIVDLTGQRFGMLTVEGLAEDKIDSRGSIVKQWNCKCDCGGHRILTGDYLKRRRKEEKSISCGCIEKQPDLSGRKVGKLTVGDRFVNSKGKTYYKCTCECGGVCEVNHYDLANEKRTSCGKCERIHRPNKIKDITGERFGKLTVIGLDPERHIRSNGSIVTKWICRCDCGRTTSVQSAALRTGRIKSCGCLLASKNNLTIEEYEETYANRKEATGKFIDITGMRFGALTAIEPVRVPGKRSKWKCLCDCGNYTEVTSTNLLSGHTQSCGCITSVGESIIGRHLDKLSIRYKKRYTNDSCKDVRNLPFDFAIFDDTESVIGIIEYDGEQHYFPVRFNGMTDDRAVEAFKIGKRHDYMKDEFCRKNHIPLLRIKYTDRDRVENLVSDFLMEISAYGAA